MTNFFIMEFEAQGVDGEDLHISLPPENEMSKLVLKNKNEHKVLLGNFTDFILLD